MKKSLKMNDISNKNEFHLDDHENEIIEIMNKRINEILITELQKHNIKANLFIAWNKKILKGERIDHNGKSIDDEFYDIKQLVNFYIHDQNHEKTSNDYSEEEKKHIKDEWDSILLLNKEDNNLNKNNDYIDYWEYNIIDTLIYNLKKNKIPKLRFLKWYKKKHIDPFLNRQIEMDKFRILSNYEDEAYDLCNTEKQYIKLINKHIKEFKLTEEDLNDNHFENQGGQ